MSRPLLITDCDEVLLHMVAHFEEWLDEAHAIDFHLESGEFASALTDQTTGEIVPPDQIWPLLIDAAYLPAGTLIRHTDGKRSVVFAPPEVEAEVTWVVVLEPKDGKTRVISRNRARFGRRVSAVIRYLFVDPGQFLFERHWLRGLKARAEMLPV